MTERNFNPPFTKGKSLRLYLWHHGSEYLLLCMQGMGINLPAVMAFVSIMYI